MTAMISSTVGGSAGRRDPCCAGRSRRGTRVWSPASGVGRQHPTGVEKTTWLPPLRAGNDCPPTFTANAPSQPRKGAAMRQRWSSSAAVVSARPPRACAAPGGAEAGRQVAATTWGGVIRTTRVRCSVATPARCEPRPRGHLPPVNSWAAPGPPCLLSARSGGRDPRYRDARACTGSRSRCAGRRESDERYSGRSRRRTWWRGTRLCRCCTSWRCPSRRSRLRATDRFASG